MPITRALLSRRSLVAGMMGGLAGALSLAALPPRIAAAADRGPPPLAGEFAKYFIVHETPMLAPPVAFNGIGGQSTSIPDFRGKTMLLNFWATWCAPCQVEMPSLDRLQEELAGEGLAVVTVSQDRGGETAVVPYFQQHGLTHLIPYTDPKGKLADAFGIRGLPTSLIIDPKGLAVGYMEGPADWSSPEGLDLVRFYLPQQQKQQDQAVPT